MDFNSLFFTWAFLPLALGAFYLAKVVSKGNKLAQEIVLFAFSLLFYLFKAGFMYFGIMIAVSFVHYLFAFLIDRYREKQVAAKVLLGVDIVLSVAMLAFFKYCGLFDFGKSIAFPLGLSFMTFQTIAFAVDVYRGDLSTKDVDPFRYLLYIFLFMKVAEGPIMSYKDIRSGQESTDMFFKGMTRFCFGLAKKVLVADVLAMVVTTINADLAIAGTALSWLSIVCFTFQILFDFSGYTDMAIGLANMFGYELMENFNDPYLSLSIQDFWRRWHMSLGNWFKNYVYIPLGGNRKGLARTILNLSIIFVLTGVWHGSDVTFVLWGLYYGFFMIMERLFLGKLLQKNPVKILNWLYAFAVVLFGWVLFCSGSLANAGYFFRNLFSPQANTSYVTVSGIFTVKVLIALCSAIIFSLIVPLFTRKHRDAINANGTWALVKCGIGFVLFVLSVVFITNNSFVPSLYGGF